MNLEPQKYPGVNYETRIYSDSELADLDEKRIFGWAAIKGTKLN